MKIELNPLKWFAKSSVEEMSPEAKAAIAVRADASATVVSVTSNSAKAVENAMATAAVVPAVKHNIFVSILQHVQKFFGVALADVIVYTPAAETLASVLFPEYAGLIKVAGDKVVSVATLLKTTVLTIQQKYSDAAPGDETNKAKLADALAIAEGPAITLLGDAGIAADTQKITDAINATVAILKLSPAPVTSTGGTTPAAG